MLLKNLFIGLGLAAVLSPLAILPAEAAITVKKSDSGTSQYVIVDGATPGSKVILTLSGSNLKRSVTGNACGQLRLTVTSAYVAPSSIKIDGGSIISVGSLTTQNYRCANGVIVDSAGTTVTPSANFKDASGAITIINQTQNQKYSVEYVGVPATLSVTVNQCGFASIKHDPLKFKDLTAFSMDGTSYTLSALMNAPAPICKNFNGIYTRFNPVP